MVIQLGIQLLAGGLVSCKAPHNPRDMPHQCDPHPAVVFFIACKPLIARLLIQRSMAPILVSGVPFKEWQLAPEVFSWNLPSWWSG